jgi:nucleotide-binding universal stress UspA family protein
MSFHKILVAIDNSPLCPPVFAAALELAQLSKATIRLLHCISNEIVGEPTVPMAMETGLPSTFLVNDYQTQHVLMERWIEDGQALLKRYQEEAASHGVLTESEYQVGEAGHLLCEVAEDWGADLVVVGRRGRTGLAEALLGSVSNHVVHHAPCSVLVIQELESAPPVETVTESSLEAIAPDLRLERS